MPTSDLPSLLDDVGFQAELERFERLPNFAIEDNPITDAQLEAIEEISRRPADAPDSGFDEAAQRRAHAALERALEPEYYEQQHHHSRTPRSRRVPAAVVLVVTVLGLIAGAGAAGMMFRGRIAQIVVDRAHTR